MSKKNKQPEMSDAEFQRIIKEHDSQGGALARQGARQTQGCWDSGIKIIQNCGHMVIPRYLIRFSQLAHEKIECLKRSYPTLEWLAYLEGRVDHGTREVFVDDLIIPDSQVVTGGHVGEVEYGWNEGKEICGVIHSHNTMGAFFSGTDDAYINQNHDVSICVSTAKGREICGQVRVKTPCGSYIINSNVDFKVDYSTVLDEKAFAKEFQPRIKTPRLLSRSVAPVRHGRKGVQDVSNVRGGQSSSPASEQLQLVDTIENPSQMDKATLIENLCLFYTEEEVEEMVYDDNVDLAEELRTCYEALGYVFGKTDDVELEYEEEEDVVFPVDKLIDDLQGADDPDIVTATETEWDTGLDEEGGKRVPIKVIQ